MQAPKTQTGEHEVTTRDELRALYGEPSERAVRKQMARLDAHCRTLIAHAPFLVLATSDAEGRLDASPRGDAPGFVQVLDEQTLLLPDRPGNNRTDSLGNGLENPQVGMPFMVAGMNETLRLNGRARITTDPALLEPHAVKGRAPKTGLLVSVEEVYLHCAKALIRSQLWDPEHFVERSSLPTMGRMLSDGAGIGPADLSFENMYAGFTLFHQFHV
jgi:PPOX class probable FMN-dependent enzyme